MPSNSFFRRNKRQSTSDEDARDYTSYTPPGSTDVDPLRGSSTRHDAFREEFVQPDGGWGWLVCATSLFANGAVFGLINTFGIIYVRIRDEYASRDSDVSFKTSWVGSVCTGMTFFMCTASSILTDRLGIRRTAFLGAILGFVGILASAFVEELELLYLTFGILLGVGGAFVYQPSLVILGHYFKRHLGLVNGIVSAGSAIVTIALSFILPVLLEKVHLKYTFVFLSGLYFLLIFMVLSWKPLIHKDTHLAQLAMSTESMVEHCHDCYAFTKKFLNLRIWRRRAYVVWVIGTAVALFGYFVPFFHLVKHTADVMPEHDGSLLVVCLSITSCIGRLVVGRLTDFEWVSRIRVKQLAFIVLGASTTCIPFAPNFGSLIAITLIMGVCDGAFICMLGPIAIETAGAKNASQAIGFLLGIMSIPMCVGPPVAGLLYDTLGSYKIAFHIAGTPPIIGALILFLVPRQTEKRRDAYELDVADTDSLGLPQEEMMLFKSSTSVRFQDDGIRNNSPKIEVEIVAPELVRTTLQVPDLTAVPLKGIIRSHERIQNAERETILPENNYDNKISNGNMVDANGVSQEMVWEKRI